MRRGSRRVPPGATSRWGPLGFATIPRVQLPDRPNHVPGTRYGDQQVHPGVQLRNGVAQTSAVWYVPTPAGIPYWQLHPLIDPAVYTRFGGSPAAPAVAAVAQAMAASQYQGVDTGEGSGPRFTLRRLVGRSR